MTTIHFAYFDGGMSAITFNFLRSGPIPSYKMTYPKEGMLVHLQKHLSLVEFEVGFLHIFNTWFICFIMFPAKLIESYNKNIISNVKYIRYPIEDCLSSFGTQWMLSTIVI